ncbi:hypothetical protein HWQ46_09645 [Shewanella sp. D64]|uniref:nuclear transport factor 2 family protein n=1 Tax=unclassified Shewanella TaxID=196818 RepID=UPI0022BA4DCF|nr:MULTISPECIES: hypothetical protein [unclassified Shewanella]MEC4725805.1 hypothetical protein [Shewanella sp. D64]MEC4737588.1 hypothetical protein [Shewanella sp. E94]WBJ93406.1 hypothetical protein HWQ47_15840 [Shewanella sp. MTB7]
MTSKRKAQIHNLLKGIETGDAEAVRVVNPDKYIQHNPVLDDALSSLHAALSESNSNGTFAIQYDKLHRILAEGNFVLSVSEGHYQGNHTSFYDLFQVEKGKIIEHWDTTEIILPKSEWKNENGKF